MAKNITPIITSIGIGAAAPFTVGHYALISSATPPFISNGRLTQLSDAVQSIAAPDVSGAAQTFVIGPTSSGGLSQKTVIVGHNLTTNKLAGSNRHVLIGGNIDYTAAAGGDSDRICIGWDMNIAVPTNSGNAIFIGMSLQVLAASGACVGIGNSVQMSGGDSVALGDSARVTGEGVSIGKAAVVAGGAGIAVGKQARANGVRAIAIGQLTQADQDNQIFIGPNISTNVLANSVIIGRSGVVFEANAWGLGTDATNGTEMRVLRLGPNTLTGYAGLSIFLPSADAANNTAGPTTTIRGGVSTGNKVAGGKISFQTSTPGASGSSYQAVAEAFRIQSGGALGAPTIAFVNQQVIAGAVVASKTLEVEINGVVEHLLVQ